MAVHERRALTAGTLFRGSTPGDLADPYVSQFLLKRAPFGAQYVEQRMRCPRPGVDYGTHFAEWLDLQRGYSPVQNIEFETGRQKIRKIRNPEIRDSLALSSAGD